MLKEKVLNEEIKLFLVGDKFRIYGKTYDVREELKNAGAKWNAKEQRLEISKDDFQKLDEEIKEKVNNLIEEQKRISIERISHILLSGDIKAYLNKDGEYHIYGKTKEIFKDLHNIGFELNDNNYAIKKEDFEREFPNQVKEFVNEYQNNNDYNKQAEEIVEEEQVEEEYFDGEQDY